MAPLSIFNIIIASIDCNYLPPSMNGLRHGNGCAGAVWQDGSPSKQYCDEDSRFPWWIHCCTWQAGRCIPKSRQLSSNANSINGIWIEDIFYNKNMIKKNYLRCKNPNYVKIKLITSGSYIRASAGTNCADDVLIRTKKECIVAGVQLVETINTRDRPSGCFYNNLYGIYYWNKHLDTSLSRPQKFGNFVGLCINKGAVSRQNG